MPGDQPQRIEDLTQDVVLDIIGGLQSLQRRARLCAPALDGGGLTIPSIAVDLAIGLDEQRRGGFLFWRKTQGVSMRRHRLRFTINAVPEPPDAPSGPASASVTIREPFFLTSAGQHAAAAPSIIWRMSLPALHDFFPPELKQKEKQLPDEVERLTDEPGRMVTFALHDEAPSLLLVRLASGSSGRNDGVFELVLGTGKVRVYSFHDDGQQEVAYAPFHRLVRTIRRWLADPEGHERTVASTLDIQHGLPTLPAFLVTLRDQYRRAAEHFAATPYSATPEWPTWYQLDDISALLTYSVRLGAAEGDRGRLDFHQSLDEPLALIESRARVRLAQTGKGMALEADVPAPEFVLSGERQKILTQTIQRQAGEVIRRMGVEADAGEYRLALESTAMARQAVCLLAYEDQDKPEPRFLVVWPNMEGNLDFAFSCLYRRDEGRVDQIVPLFDLGDRLRDFPIGKSGDAPGELRRGAYKHFRRFFRAAIAWRDRREAQP